MKGNETYGWIIKKLKIIKKRERVQNQEAKQKCYEQLKQLRSELKIISKKRKQENKKNEKKLIKKQKKSTKWKTNVEK